MENMDKKESMAMERTITTDRLLLRPFAGGDLDILLRLYGDEEVLRYTPFDIMDETQAQTHLQKVVRDWECTPVRSREYVIILKESGEKIGRCHIAWDLNDDGTEPVLPAEDGSEPALPAEDGSTGSKGRVMIGWLLVKEAWGNGYATETAEALLGYAFDTLHAAEAYGWCHPGNEATKRVMEKSGMPLTVKRESFMKYEKQGTVTWEEEWEYAVSSEDWHRFVSPGSRPALYDGEGLQTAASSPVIVIRDVRPEDDAFILALNEEEVDVMSPMDEAGLAYFKKHAALFKVACVEERVPGGQTPAQRPAGFLIVLTEGLDYGSENYKYFCSAYRDFLYVDRIAVDAASRRLHVARELYRCLFRQAAMRGFGTVTAEIDTKPIYNAPSLAFHSGMGFEEAGRQWIRGGTIEVSLEARRI